MNVIICGAGEVGTHAAEVLGGEGHNITVIDAEPHRLRSIEDAMDVRTLLGNCADAAILREAGAENPKVAFVAATSSDEINLLSAAIARGMGAGSTIARVHHAAYFNNRGSDYKTLLGIGRLICPDYSTAQTVASTLRNPVANFMESFAGGRIELQEFPVTEGAPAVGKELIELSLPKGIRLAAIRRGDAVFLPTATTRIEVADVVILVGNTDAFQEGRKVFQKKGFERQRVVIMGDSPTAIWLCRALQDRTFSIRLFVTDRERAEELAGELNWVTVVHADPTDATVFEEERIVQADAFVGVDLDDEHNILGCAFAKSRGVKLTVAVVHQPRYVQLIQRIGIDHAYSPRRVAVRQIARTLDPSALLKMASLAEGVIDCYRVTVGGTAPAIGTPLRKLNLTPDWMIAALQHEEDVFVPTADDFIHAGDIVTVLGKHGAEKRLSEIFDAR